MQRKAVLGLLLLTLWAGPAWAEAGPRAKTSYPVVFHTYPPKLWVYRYHPENSDSGQDDCLGQSQSKNFLDISEREQNDDWLIYFVYVGGDAAPQLSAKGFRPAVSEMLRIRAGALAGVGRYPLRGEYRPVLTSEQWRSFYVREYLLGYWWAWLTLLGLAGLSLWKGASQARRAYGAMRREEERAVLTADMFRGDPLEGQMLGDYLLLSRIGEGGMGIVYRAVPKDDPDPDKMVAIKLIRGVDPDQRVRFLRECQLYQRFRHVNVLTMLETGLADVAGHEGGWPYMVTEYISGQSLRQVIDANPQGLTLRQAAVFVVQIARGLAHCHQVGVIHRDIKPENVLVCHSKLEDGHPRVVVMDFGLARGADFRTLTKLGEVMGTPAYMSPEQLKGEEVEASDQYSLGMLAYEMLTGSLPFKGDSPAQIIMQQLHHEPRSLKLIKPNLPDNVVTSVHRMLSKDPDKRFHHMVDIIPEWDALAQSRPKVPARKESVNPLPGSSGDSN